MNFNFNIFKYFQEENSKKKSRKIWQVFGKNELWFLILDNNEVWIEKKKKNSLIGDFKVRNSNLKREKVGNESKKFLIQTF